MPDDPHRLEALVRELQTAALALPDAITERITEFRNAALAAARDEVAGLRRRLAAAEARAVQAETAADENGHAVDAAERALASARADADALRAELASAHAETARLRESRPRPARDVAADRRHPPHGRTTPPAGPVTSAAPASSSAETPLAEAAAGPAARIAEVFRAWCGEATPVMGKVEFFAGRVRTALPEALVTAVYRDANSQATPVALGAQGGASPVEHWLVALDGRHWLLPQPMAAAQFRELAPCFDGTATPATLAALTPAEVRVVGDRYEVPRPGRVA